MRPFWFECRHIWPPRKVCAATWPRRSFRGVKIGIVTEPGKATPDSAAGGSADADVVNPRLIDGFRLRFNQDDVPFAVPHLKEDLPFAVDPFLFWKSDNAEYRDLHVQLTSFLNRVVKLEADGLRSEARRLLLGCSEARELGLGYGRGTKAGTAFGPKLVESALDVLGSIPQVAAEGLSHIEVLGLLVPLVAEDRLSDLAASVLKRFFIDYTREHASNCGIPMRRFALDSVWDWERNIWKSELTELPYNPIDESPILLAPLELLRHLPWINYEDYYRSAYSRVVLPPTRASQRRPKTAVLDYNRRNFVSVERYIEQKEREAPACQPDPLFRPLGLPTLRKKIADLQKLPTGRDAGADKKFENLAYDVLASLLYPELEFAESQVRTVSGAHIRDIIFYNDGKNAFLKDLRERFAARQLVFELKNVASLTGEHVNQLYRYLDAEFGNIGFLVTRRPLPRAVKRNVVDLHSSKRCVVIALDESDLQLMVNLLDSGRRPIEAVKKKYVEFTRWLPK